MLCAMEAHLNGLYFWIRTEADTTPSIACVFLRCDRATIVRSGWVKGQVVAGLAERSCFKLGMGLTQSFQVETASAQHSVCCVEVRSVSMIPSGQDSGRSNSHSPCAKSPSGLKILQIGRRIQKEKEPQIPYACACTCT